MVGSIRRVSAVALVAVATALLTVVSASGSPREATRPANGDWIAYATAPANDQTRRSGYPGGSDVFISKPGGTPLLVAGRGNGSIWNVCPAFSPSGKLLAFGQKSPRGQSIRIVGVSRDGSIRDERKVLRVRRSTAPCPKWSADSKRLAYLDSKRKLVVLTIGGVARPRRAGDPTRSSFSRDDQALVSPDGTLVARRDTTNHSCLVFVSRRDGTGRRLVDDSPCSYATAGWSPDSQKLLVMKDMDGQHFAMVVVPVNAPAERRGIVTGVQVNHARSWPGYGDVSWQPKP
jgi:WD40 repeat protein